MEIPEQTLNLGSLESLKLKKARARLSSTPIFPEIEFQASDSRPDPKIGEN